MKRSKPQGWWFHLRRCAQCGHVGCCDSSPSRHASAHAAGTGHWFVSARTPPCSQRSGAHDTVLTTTPSWRIGPGPLPR
ncbi:MAG TPA: UBP-type zinc finger domain-containing protein [Nonomuraea sp.]|nr:UBP-type zinc finger domain-containing protein [Nonomuraea sp.]